jgi:hypothetical protein
MNKHKKEGSGLFLVLIISTALGIGIYSTLSLVDGEFQRNKKASAYHEAKQAAESLLQASMADLKTRFESQDTFPIDTLSPSRNPLSISNEFVEIYSASDSRSNLVIPEIKKYTSKNQFNTQATEVIGGQVPPGQWLTIDPRIPGNETDELAGTRVKERSIELISKATVNRVNVGSSTVHARQFLQVRDAPLFAYAIFYNLPMEIAPGPRMDVFGNVHSNWPVWLQSGGGLNFHSKFTTAGGMFHGRHPDSGQSNSNGPVRFKDASANLVNMEEDSSWPEESRNNFNGSWLTSHADNFVDLSNQIWDGNVQTEVFPQNPVGVTDYIEDTDSSTNRKESYNSAYSLIQPALEESELAIPTQSDNEEAYQDALRLNEVEKQKYAYKAGLTIEFDPTKPSNQQVTFYTFERNAAGDVTYDSGGAPIRILLTPETPAEPIADPNTFFELNGEIVHGLHDKRLSKDLNIVEINIGKLAELVHANDETKWGGNENQKPDSWWNGVVYVDFPQQNATSTRDDRVNPAIENWGVKLINGKKIPNPKFRHDDNIYGMSLATNQMLYVEGHYNADGDLDTGSPTEPDNPDNFLEEGYEAPAALIADSITFLSEDWEDANSTENNTNNRRADHTEVSAAILTGLVPSGETGSNSYSGGVENFPRFLERWTGKTFRIRGSMVALFESEVATNKWGSNNVYNPPNRAWGFHEEFGKGYMPPGTPNTRRYRSVDFQLITADDYATHVSRIQSYF